MRYTLDALPSKIEMPMPSVLPPASEPPPAFMRRPVPIYYWHPPLMSWPVLLLAVGGSLGLVWSLLSAALHQQALFAWLDQTIPWLLNQLMTVF